MRLRGFPTNGQVSVSYVGSPTGAIVGTSPKFVDKVLSVKGPQGPAGPRGPAGPAGRAYSDVGLKGDALEFTATDGTKNTVTIPSLGNAALSAASSAQSAIDAASSATAAGQSKTAAAGSAAAAAQSAKDAAAAVSQGMPSASATVVGAIKLTGDLGGSYDSPTVPGLAGKAAKVHTHAMSDVTGLQSALDTKLDQTQVDARVKVGTAALVGQAPTTLDTLNELASALGNDPNFATTVATQIGKKADATHAHTIANVTGLQAALDAKGTSNLTIGTTSTTALRGDAIQVVASLPASPVAGVLYCIPE
ncbi:phage tail fiber repeat family protein [Nocardia sp. IFM 10818]